MGFAAISRHINVSVTVYLRIFAVVYLPDMSACNALKAAAFVCLASHASYTVYDSMQISLDDATNSVDRFLTNWCGENVLLHFKRHLHKSTGLVDSHAPCVQYVRGNTTYE